MMMEFESKGGSGMLIRSAGKVVVAAVTVACLALLGSQPARAQVKLQYKFPEGKTLAYKTASNAFQVLTLMGMEIQSRERKTIVWTQMIGKRRGDSSLPVEVKVRSLRADLRLQGGIDLSYDSIKPGHQIKDPDFAPLEDVYQLESEVAYTVVLDDKDKIKVKGIEGTEKLQEKAGKLDAISREQIRGRINPDILKTQFEQEHQNLPDVLARPGEPWERTERLEIAGGQVLTFRKKFEYLGTEKKGDKTLDKISSKVLEVHFKPDPDSQAPLKVTKSSLKINSSEGTILFDREAGCLVESRERIQLKGTMTFSGGGTDTATPIELTVQTNTQLQPTMK
jgi:hypothetical protein